MTIFEAGLPVCRQCHSILALTLSLQPQSLYNRTDTSLLNTDVNTTTVHVVTCCCHRGHAVVVTKLLKAGADASIQDNDPRAPRTALHWACIRGHSRAMEKLYDSTKLPEQTQLELMSLAVSHGHTTVVAIFQV